MNDITIVTAFFDIGRGNWTPDKGLPHYLQRTNETYLERFAHMATLDNDMIVYTSEDMVDTIKSIRGGKPIRIITMDFKNSFENLREKIKDIQNDSSYLSKINPNQIKNPEYWNADYVLVNLLKSSFVSNALQYVNTELVAWLDFGYCRTKETLNGVTHWKYPFNKDKIHFWNIKEFRDGTYIQDIIANNDVHITGPCIVAGKEKWPTLQHLVHHNVSELIKHNMMDDDQTFLLMSYLQMPELFELHRVAPDDWFIIFKDYHDNTN